MVHLEKEKEFLVSELECALTQEEESLKAEEKEEEKEFLFKNQWLYQNH